MHKVEETAHGFAQIFPKPNNFALVFSRHQFNGLSGHRIKAISLEKEKGKCEYKAFLLLSTCFCVVGWLAFCRRSEALL